MLERQLRRFREAVRVGAYDITYHGLDEMEQDDLSALDVESCILTGAIDERQRDRRTGERKYVIHGRSLDGGKMAVLTVYKL